MARKQTPNFERLPVCHRLPRWMVDWLGKQAVKTHLTKTDLVEIALMQHYRLKEPKS